MADDLILAELQHLNESVSELVNVVRLTAYPRMKDAILSEFGGTEPGEQTNSIKRTIYALSDGKNSSRDIERIVGGSVKFQTIARYQQQWRKQGLATPVGGRGKTKALFDLGDFGLEVE